MDSHWVVSSMGDHLELELDQVTVQPGREYPVVGVLNGGRGLLTRPPVTSKTTSYPRLNRVLPGRVLYRKLTAYEGAIAVAPEELGEAFVSPEFPTFRCTESLLPPYARLMTQHPRVWEELALLCKGVGGRRERLHPRDFLTMRVLVPPVSVQRRIVNLMNVVDEAIAYAVKLHGKASAAQSALVENMPGELARLGELLLRIDAGRSPVGTEGPLKAGDRAVLKVSAIGPDGFRPYEVKIVSPDTELDPRMAVRANDILMVRANGVLRRVGAVCKTESDFDQLYLCDKTLRLVPKPDAVTPDWLFAALTSAGCRDQIEARTTGSHMRNISQAAIKEIVIPVPSLPEQEAFGATLAACASVTASAAENVDKLRVMRFGLLQALLTGEHEIPESYDQLIGA
jgi:Restriction endonuclease S subunits